MAEYSTLIFYEAYPDYNVTRQDYYNATKKAYELFIDVYAQLVKEQDTSMKRHLKDFSSDYEYVNLVYRKGVLMWENYRSAVGDKRFFAGLKKFYQENLFQNATTDDLFLALERAGAGGTGLLSSYIDGSAII